MEAKEAIRDLYKKIDSGNYGAFTMEKLIRLIVLLKDSSIYL